MFLFYHPKQDSANLNYYKGLLFEQLLKQYLNALGFSVDVRQKVNSLEYDLVGRSMADGRQLIGEAKAHGRSIAGEVITSFVGKLLIPQLTDPHVAGLFLSSSSLTAEAEDYLRRVQESPAAPRVTTRSGDRLREHITDALHLPTDETARQIIQGLGAFPLSANLLATENGPLVLALGASAGAATPTQFCLIRADGSVVSDPTFLADAVKRVPELGELSPLSGARTNQTLPPGREIAESLLLGKDWADYRLPAPPEFFVGRRGLTHRIVELLQSSAHPGIIQIKSRSGVGKSSLMAYLLAALRADGMRVQLYDVRNTKNVFDVLSVIQRFTESSYPPSDFSEVERQLDTLTPDAGKRAVLLLDQFESTFVSPDLFDAYESLAVAVAKRRPQLAVVFARKNDLLTTYDDLHISLDRLNRVSTSLLLEDFSADEAVELIGQISKHARRPASAAVKHYVLEFARGFPWLLKRTMAHVLNLSQRAEGRADLLSTTLRLDDLFNEELEGLDEIERGYLTKIAQRLPATYQQLERAFDEDPGLPAVIRKLTETRLVRLSGSTYDTYNDVFKEYLVYRRLPEFRISFVYKLTPGNVLPAFHRLYSIRRFTTEQVSKHLGAARGTTFNILHELRAFELVDRDGKGWIVPDVVVEVVERQRLGEYIRQQLMQNGVVSDLLVQLQSGDPIKVSDIPTYLRSQLPFVPASSTTWESYASILSAWLETVHLTNVENGLMSVSTLDRSEAARRMGNLRMRARGKRSGTAPFAPSARFGDLLRVVRHGKQMAVAGQSRSRLAAARDLFDLGLADESGELLVTEAEVIPKLRVHFEQPPYRDVWAAMLNRSCTTEQFCELFQMQSMAESTVKWRAKVLANWGRSLGILPNNFIARLRRTPAVDAGALALFQ